MRTHRYSKTIAPTVLVAVGLLFLVSPGQAMEIASLAEKISLEPSGAARVEIAAKFAKAEPGTLLVPTGFKTVEDLKIDGLPGASVALVEKEGIRSLTITAPQAPSEKQAVKISFSAPGFYDWKGEKPSDFGNRSLQYRFLNTLPAKVQSYKLELLLPEGFLVNTIEDSQPKLTSKSPVPPYQIVRNGDQYGITIKASKLGVGDFSMLRIRFKDGSKSTGFLLAALAVCALYLIGFRDTIRPPAKLQAQGAVDGR